MATVVTARATSSGSSASPRSTAAGLNLAGVKRVLELEEELHALHENLERVRREARDAVDEASRRNRRELVPLSQSLMVWGRRPSIFDEGS